MQTHPEKNLLMADVKRLQEGEADLKVVVAVVAACTVEGASVLAPVARAAAKRFFAIVESAKREDRN